MTLIQRSSVMRLILKESSTYSKLAYEKFILFDILVLRTIY